MIYLTMLHKLLTSIYSSIQVQDTEVPSEVARHECRDMFPQRSLDSAAEDVPQRHRSHTTQPATGDHPGGRLLR